MGQITAWCLELLHTPAGEQLPAHPGSLFYPRAALCLSFSTGVIWEFPSTPKDPCLTPVCRKCRLKMNVISLSVRPPGCFSPPLSLRHVAFRDLSAILLAANQELFPESLLLARKKKNLLFCALTVSVMPFSSSQGFFHTAAFFACATSSTFLLLMLFDTLRQSHTFARWCGMRPPGRLQTVAMHQRRPQLSAYVSV